MSSPPPPPPPPPPQVAVRLPSYLLSGNGPAPQQRLLGATSFAYQDWQGRQTPRAGR